MNKQLITKLANNAASDCVKTADFGLINLLKGLFGGSGLDLKGMMPYMTGLTVPLAKGIGGVAGIPGIAGMLDMANGGENFATLTGYGNFSSASPAASGGPTSNQPKPPTPQATGAQQAGQTSPPNVAPSTPTASTPPPAQPTPPAPRMWGNADISQANKPLPPTPPGAPKRRMWGNAYID
jgi:hypothetical protein